MTVSGNPSTSLLDSVLQAARTRQQISVEVLDKAQEITKREGQSMVELIEAAAPPTDGMRLDAYA